MTTPQRRRQLLVGAVIVTVLAGGLLVLGAVLRSIPILVIAVVLAVAGRTVAWQWTRAGHRKPPKPPERRIL